MQNARLSAPLRASFVIRPAAGYIQPMNKLSPIESEFATTEEAEAHDAWLRAKVEKAMASKNPRIPHDQVMAEMQAIIDRHKSATKE